MKGQTLLPLPPASTVPQLTSEPNLKEQLKDQDKIHILESAIVTWTKQIKNVLKSDPDAPLKQPGSYPGPLVELGFWTERAGNLNSIHDQLTGEKITKVVNVLELARSTYYPAFQRCVHLLHQSCSCLIFGTGGRSMQLNGQGACSGVGYPQLTELQSGQCLVLAALFAAGCFRRLSLGGRRQLTMSNF